MFKAQNLGDSVKVSNMFQAHHECLGIDYHTPADCNPVCRHSRCREIICDGFQRDN